MHIPTKISTMIAVLCAMALAQINFNVGGKDVNFNDLWDLDFGTYQNGQLSNIEMYSDLHVIGDGPGGYGQLITDYVYVYKNLQCYGNKNFVHPHPTDSTRMIVYSAMESGEVLTLARGVGKTSNGRARILLPEHFTMVTSREVPPTVIVTPENAPVLLYAADKSTERIVVVMKEADFYEYGDAAFSYQVTGVREGYENERIVRTVGEETLARHEHAEPRDKREQTNYEKRAERLLRQTRRITDEIEQQRESGVKADAIDLDAVKREVGLSE